MAQLAEWSLPKPEIRGSNLDIGDEKVLKYLAVNCSLERAKIKKRPKLAFKKCILDQ